MVNPSKRPLWPDHLLCIPISVAVPYIRVVRMRITSPNRFYHVPIDMRNCALLDVCKRRRHSRHAWAPIISDRPLSYSEKERGASLLRHLPRCPFLLYVGGEGGGWHFLRAKTTIPFHAKYVVEEREGPKTR